MLTAFFINITTNHPFSNLSYVYPFCWLFHHYYTIPKYNNSITNRCYFMKPMGYKYNGNP